MGAIVSVKSLRESEYPTHLYPLALVLEACGHVRAANLYAKELQLGKTLVHFDLITLEN